MFRYIRNLDISFDENLGFAKAKTKEAALSSFGPYKSNVPQNLSNDEFIALQNLSKNKDLIIQKSGKGNSVVIINRQDYIKKMDNILIDQKIFNTVNLKDYTFLKFYCQPRKTC